MNFLRLTPVLMSALLMAAHFSRAGNLVFVIISLAAPFLLVLRYKWVALVFQVALVLAAMEWLRSLLAIAVRRQEMGEPWIRMAVILGAVALLTALSALVFWTKGMKERYSR